MNSKGGRLHVSRPTRNSASVTETICNVVGSPIHWQIWGGSGAPFKKSGLATVVK